MPVILNCGAKVLLLREMCKKKALIDSTIKTIKFIKIGVTKSGSEDLL